MSQTTDPAGLNIFAITGIGEIRPRDDLAGIISTAAAEHHGGLLGGDVLVVTQKIVSKAEGMLEKVDPEDPLAHKALVERESVRVLRRRGELIISETEHGFVCANAGKLTAAAPIKSSCLITHLLL